MRLLSIGMLGFVAVLSIVGCMQTASDSTVTDLSTIEIGVCQVDGTVDVKEPVDLFLTDSVRHFTPGSDSVQVTQLLGGPITNVSCSSRDRTKDCFCGDKGCWRTQNDCGCCP